MSSSADFDKLTSTYHADQLEGLGAVLARLGSLSTEEVRELLPNVVRHLERSGYPSVVGKSIECLRLIMDRHEPVLEDEFARWNGVPRLVATLDHAHLDVRVACTVFLAQLSKNARWNDAFAVAKGYRVLVEKMASNEEREQLAAIVALRVLLQQKDSNVSDFSRVNGFPVLFKLIRGQTPASNRVLGQAIDLLRLGAANRAVAIEIKASRLESDVLQHLSKDAAVQGKVLDCFAAMLEDEACAQFIKKNNAAPGLLTAYAYLDGNQHTAQAKALLEQIK